MYGDRITLSGSEILEKEFKIAIPDEETFNVKTVADIIQVVANHM